MAVTILTGDPVITVLAEMQLDPVGIDEMVGWVARHRPECLPEERGETIEERVAHLFPHDTYENMPGILHNSRRKLTDNELLVELASRKCYDSFGLKAGRKSNKEYIEHTQSSDPAHSSVMYHAKMSFFFAGISRRVSHEIIRNYVGSDRTEEGSPSQESTRFTHHYGYFVEPPKYYLHQFGTPEHNAHMREAFREAMQTSYDYYLQAVEEECRAWESLHGSTPKQMARKRIYEAASSFLPHQAETSFVWTSNPVAIAKFCKERDNEAADLEIQRFARKWKRVCVERWPNLFTCFPWMTK